VEFGPQPLDRRKWSVVESLVFFLFFLVMVFLYLERLFLNRQAARIRWRIAVTGTRGKSTVTRLVAAALREAHFSVLAKTTGSKPVLILPDGQEEEVRRSGRPTVLEQKKIVARGARLGVDSLVVEMMSIQPECLRVESHRLLKPHLLVMTNVRVDHRPEQGRSKQEITQSFSSSIPPHATVFLLEEELRPEIETTAARMGARIVVARKKSVNDHLDSSKNLWLSLEENTRLALAVTDFLGVPRETAWRGFGKAKPDFGGLKAWRMELGHPPAPWILVSAFAANEPESTTIVLSYVKKRLASVHQKIIGVLNLRPDRGDRSLQWMEACADGFLLALEKLYVVGGHVRSFQWKKLARAAEKVILFGSTSPQQIMARIVADEPSGAILFGLGNMGGLGARLVELWEEKGDPYAI